MKDINNTLQKNDKGKFLNTRKHREIHLKKWMGWAGGYSNSSKKTS